MTTCHKCGAEIDEMEGVCPGCMSQPPLSPAVCSALPPYVNPNPRIGVLLDQNAASVRTKNVLWRFHMRGINWLQKNWPEERMRRELRGYGPKTSREWNTILAARLRK